jgi:hypothetical protein
MLGLREVVNGGNISRGEWQGWEMVICSLSNTPECLARYNDQVSCELHNSSSASMSRGPAMEGREASRTLHALDAFQRTPTPPHRVAPLPRIASPVSGRLSTGNVMEKARWSNDR